MRNNLTLTAIMLVSVFLLEACGNNAIYYDEEEKALRPCGYQRISYFGIMNLKDSSSCVYMSKANSRNTSAFYLHKSNDSYEQVKCTDNFSLRYNARYVITNRTIRDAVQWRMVIDIDKNGNIKQISPKVKCE